MIFVWEVLLCKNLRGNITWSLLMFDINKQLISFNKWSAVRLLRTEEFECSLTTQWHAPLPDTQTPFAFSIHDYHSVEMLHIFVATAAFNRFNCPLVQTHFSSGSWELDVFYCIVHSLTWTYINIREPHVLSSKIYIVFYWCSFDMLYGTWKIK